MKIDFNKNADGLVPAIIQDSITKNVLMLAYMNQEAFDKTNETGLVTFYSRSRKSLWTKGETSGNFLKLKDIKVDCDNDTLLIQVEPVGPACHTGAATCFEDQNGSGIEFFKHLQNVIQDRKANPSEGSYTNKLFAKGINKVAQKVGEEAVELVIEAKDDNRDLFLGEAADLMYHLIVLLTAKGETLENVAEVLHKRHK